MLTRRYTIVIADRTTGVVRRATVSVRAVLATLVTVLAIPVLLSLGAKWSARAEIEQLRTANSVLSVETGNYRAATGELTTQIQALESVINELGTRASLAPEQARAIKRLPAVIKATAVGGALQAAAGVSSVLSSLTTPEDVFSSLRGLLQALDNRLRYVRRDVERQEALAAATPSIWPAHGWLTGLFGGRSDPFTGEAGFHQGLDISTDKGKPVYATADGTVETAAYSGDYGKLIVLKHDFGLTTRYGHLSGFSVKTGDTVKRNDVIGFVGSTGRSTGAHLHYEILANGKMINPLRLLTQRAN